MPNHIFPLTQMHADAGMAICTRSAVSQTSLSLHNSCKEQFAIAPLSNIHLDATTN